MKKVCLLVIFLVANGFAQQAPRDYAKYVDPLIGTGAHGHTFPGATRPFGMVQLSPDTREDNWDGSSGYHYSDTTIWGFSHTHLSGTGIPDYCDILFAPTIGEPEFFARAGDLSENGYASVFDHKNERAEPGYYAVKLDEGNIFAEMTATARVGFHRYTFPAGTTDANLILDLKHRDKVLDAELRIVGRNRVEGFRRSSSWAKDQVVYFVAEFSEPFADYGITTDGAPPEPTSGAKGTNLKAYFRFAAARPVLVKVALSPTGISGARRNLAAELPHWEFEKVRAEARAEWNRELSQIEVAGGTDAQLKNFYTALYHTKIQPNIFQDFDGGYRGLDGRVRTAPKNTHYTVFSLWDTFRAAHPLYTITDRRRTVDFINTFLRQYDDGGRLPVWELAGNETDTMIGYHAVSVIADAMTKGLEGFDYEKAYAAAKHSAELDHFGLAAYKKRGYIAMEDENESVSKTLEYAYNDFCIAQMARVLMKKKGVTGTKDPLVLDYGRYLQRAQFYKNLFDRETGFMRPKQNGNWIAPFAPNEVTFHFTEGNSWVYTFFVPHDVSGLIDLYGGRRNFAARLDELLTTDQKLAGRFQPDITGLIGQYAHGNEPSHHIAYLYNYAGEPWKTQRYVRKILDEFYKPTPDGLIGNEDCGQMSAWYILSALGFYPVSPSIPNYDLGSPLFAEARINLENGKTFTVRARNASAANVYVKSVRLNGRPLRKTFITHAELAAGGTLEFEMTGAPVKNWFGVFSTARIEPDFPAVPTIDGARTFRDRTEVRISLPAAGAKIYYTTDGRTPDETANLYTKPFTVEQTTTVKARAVAADGTPSLPAEARLSRIPHDWTVSILSKYNRQYTGGGDAGLIDGLRGTVNFASGEWQGYQGQDFTAIVDLQRETAIRRVGGGFLQVARSWIWMPTKIEFAVSKNGADFERVAEIDTAFPAEEMTPTIRDYAQTLAAPVSARYVRVTARNLGKIPAWHPGAGSEAFIFIDELFID